LNTLVSVAEMTTKPSSAPLQRHSLGGRAVAELPSVEGYPFTARYLVIPILLVHRPSVPFSSELGDKKVKKK